MVEAWDVEGPGVAGGVAVAQTTRLAGAVNRSQSAAELEAIRRSVARGQPYVDEPWVRQTAGQLGLESTLRPRGRPRKAAS